MLWFGWFGFNAGSATSAFVVTNTAAAALTWVAIDLIVIKRASVVGAATGAVVGLATITPASGFVGPMPVLLIGFVASILSYSAVWLKNRCRLDDSLDVWAVHGIGSTWGVLATGLFVGIGFLSISEFTGLGRGDQMLRQLTAIGVTSGWAFVMTLVILFALKHTIGVRVSEEEEEQGLDLSQHAEEAYRD